MAGWLFVRTDAANGFGLEALARILVVVGWLLAELSLSVGDLRSPVSWSVSEYHVGATQSYYEGGRGLWASDPAIPCGSVGALAAFLQVTLVVL